MQHSMRSSATPIDPFAETMRFSLIADTEPVERLSPMGEFHEGELGWFQTADAPPGPATNALARANAACPATSYLIVAGATIFPLLLLAFI